MQFDLTADSDFDGDLVSSEAHREAPGDDPVFPRVLPEEDGRAGFWVGHDEIWRCLCTMMQISADQTSSVKDAATLPMILGGIGLRSAARVSKPANSVSWADCLSMIHNRHPIVAALFVWELNGVPTTHYLWAASSARTS